MYHRYTGLANQRKSDSDQREVQNLYDVVSHLDQDWLLIAQPRLNSLLQIPEHSAETLAIVRKLGNWPNEYADIKVKIERLSTDALNISKSLSAENQLHENDQSLALLDTRLKDLGASFEQWKANSQAKHTEHEQALRLIDSVNQSTAGRDFYDQRVAAPRARVVAPGNKGYRKAS